MEGQNILKNKFAVLLVDAGHVVSNGEQIMRAEHNADLLNVEIEFLQKIEHRYQADEQIIKPMVKAAADKYAAEKKLTRRSPQDCQS